MAAPSHKTLQNLSGTWTLNATLSDDPTPALQLQGVNPLIRKAATSASVQLTVSQPDQSHINMKQNATSFKIPGTAEEYTLDWQWRETKDPVFGELKGRSRWIGREDAVREGAEGEFIEGDSEGMLIQAQGDDRDGKWTGTHFWGFEMVDGARRHVRRVRISTREGKEVKMRMVYDFDGE